MSRHLSVRVDEELLVRLEAQSRRSGAVTIVGGETASG